MLEHQLIAQFVKGLFTAGDEDKVVLFGGESSGKGFANAARCACDERYLHRSLSVSTGVRHEK